MLPHGLTEKKKKENKPTKYCWYVAFVSSDYDGEWSLHKTGIELCSNRSNYKKRKIREWENLSRQCDTGSVYSPFFICEVAPKLYKTQKEAKLALGQYLHERMSKDEQ